VAKVEIFIKKYNRMAPSSFNLVTVDLEALKDNYTFLKGLAGKAAFLSMVKADGYGHGMVQCSKALAHAGCTIFGVAELGEAIELRQCGIDGTIFSMIGFDPSDAQYFIDYNITPVVYDAVSIAALSSAAASNGTTIGVHVKVDTGMKRLGVQLEEIDQLLACIERLPGVRLAGLASHFPCADDITSETTSRCYDIFAQFKTHIGKNDTPVYHIANSGGTIYFPKTRADMVRCGISLYGYYPEGREYFQSDELRPVMSFTTKVLQVKSVPAGVGVSYGHTYITEKPTVLAVLPVGYEDGYSRNLSNCGEVLIRGQRAPVRGRVCMNLCMVDVTEIEGVSKGDDVVLLGSQGNERITADEIAARIDTISYEVLCMIGNNNQRKYV
jgi:alanine racemase